MKTLAINIFCGITLAALLVIAYGNYVVLDEMYGAGPPYFSRTLNMDKWVNPIPRLILMDTASVLAVAAAFHIRKRISSSPTKTNYLA